MQQPFGSTLRSLEGERAWAIPVAALLAGLVLLAWLGWFVLAEVPVYVVSETARLEASRAVHALTAEVEGRIVRVGVVLGQRVAVGDVVLELAAEIPARRIEEERERIAALRAQLVHRRRELASRRRGRASAQRVSALAIDEAAARYDAARAVLGQVEEQARRKEVLFVQGLLSELELVQERAELARQRAAVAELALARRRLEAERAGEDDDRGSSEEEIRREIARIEGDVRASLALVGGLEEEAARRLIRAPVAGTIGELSPVGVGARVAPGERLGTIVPLAALEVVGTFRSDEALGRVRAGQPAELRLNAFPWTEHGTVGARVARVAQEAREGRVWVALAPLGEVSSIPLQHGLSGSVAVEVERLSPAALLLHAMGKRWARAAGRSEPTR